MNATLCLGLSIFSLRFSVSLFLSLSLSLSHSLYLSFLFFSFSLSLLLISISIFFIFFGVFSSLFHIIPHFSMLYCHFILYITQFNSTQFFSNFVSIGTFLTSSNFIFLYLSSFNLYPSSFLISTSYCFTLSSRVKFKLILFYHIFFFNNTSYFIKVCQIMKYPIHHTVWLDIISLKIICQYIIIHTRYHIIITLLCYNTYDYFSVHTYRIALSLFFLSMATPPRADNRQLKNGIKNNSALLYQNKETNIELTD